MKTKFLKPLILILCLNLSCSKETITDAELNVESTSENAQKDNLLDENNAKPIPNSTNNNVVNTTSVNSRTGFDITDNDGNAPSEVTLSILVDYPNNYTENQKNIVRNSYNIYGELLGYDICLFDFSKEVWSFKATTLTINNIDFIVPNTGGGSSNTGESGGSNTSNSIPVNLLRLVEAFIDENGVDFIINGSCE